MSEEPKGPGAVVLGWWSKHIAARETSSAKALAARLRRAAPMAVLCEPAVQELARDLSLGPMQAERLVQLAGLLAEVREHTSARLARRLGGVEPVLSPLRFQRLIRAEGAELTDLMRRAITMADHKCNVAALAADILHWEAARPRWCFDYFGADAPAKAIEEKTQ
ncbi:CRISPR system Cascade subunit CasB [Rhodobacter aestuarii]|uniref:CRISPR system Cascade subunit CasB n=1 Tax=Rhodobacter aestuarii TaxID=453582 RepID=A0A1N7Q2X2_9RHOB|nr:type I-E CRISPR-associated protein Cse2/CasB [Rhodobacter aestuarii]PTV94066.1 CRISPR system Cascade subunit CasB [Rhodobacter aestuarii]SIT17198.1 CRISPR system Cascade subunit CasB [Rhodobacter aestuarii]